MCNRVWQQTFTFIRIFFFFIVLSLEFQVIELDPEQLPDGEEVLSILRQEHSQINTWVNVAVSVMDLCVLCFFFHLFFNFSNFHLFDLTSA